MPTFTDEQKKAITFSQAATPKEIVDSNTYKDYIVIQRDAAKKIDDSYVPFTDYYHAVINQFQRERTQINGSTLAEYDLNQIVLGASKAPGNLHFPVDAAAGGGGGGDGGGIVGNIVLAGNVMTIQDATAFYAAQEAATKEVDPPWVNFIPKVITGNYMSSTGTITSQQTLLSDVVAQIDVLLTYPESVRLNPPLGPINPEPPPPNLPHPVIADKAELDRRVTLVPPSLNAQKTELTANITEVVSEISQNTIEMGHIDNTLAAITTWNGSIKYSNADLAALKTAMTSKTTTNTTRISEINTNLGSLSQFSNGTYVGSGHYKNMFTWIDTRISRAGGSLTTYYNKQFAVTYFNNKIAMLNGYSNELEKDFWTRLLVHDAPSTTTTLDVYDAAELMTNEVISICDNQSPIINRTILSISSDKTTEDGLVYRTIALEASIGINLTIKEFARVFKSI